MCRRRSSPASTYRRSIAVVAADTAGATLTSPRRLALAGRVYTGDVPSVAVTPGHAVEIATGAPLPEGADAVIMVEETAADGDTIVIRSAVTPRQNVGPKGADITIGQVVIEAGAVLTPARIGALAALGHADVEVWARPTVAILSTGNEIASQGRPLEPGQIYDINRFTLSTLVAEHGGAPVPVSTARDTLDALYAALDECLRHDVIVFSGGSSVGERDLILDIVRERGTVRFHGVAVKPGKPTLFGHVEGRPVFGMPGYPTSCLSNAYILLVPALRRMAHREGRRSRWPRTSRPWPAGTSSIPCGWRTGVPYRPSRPPATSPRCRGRTATSRSQPR